MNDSLRKMPQAVYAYMGPGMYDLYLAPSSNKERLKRSMCLQFILEVWPADII